MNTETIDIIIHKLENYLTIHDNPVVATSFGKDSGVALHLARQVMPDIPCVFNNTLVENPDTIRFKKRLVDEWNLNLVEVKPLNGWTFWKVVEKYGFPVGQRRGGSATTKCCYYLKKAPMKRAMKEHGWDLVIDGMSIYESRQRYLNFIHPKNPRTDPGYRFNKGWNCHKYSPIWNWKPSDVWDYIEHHNLPYNPYYDKELSDNPRFTKRGHRDKGFYRCLRVGCWPCTIPLKYEPDWTKHLRMFYPHLYKLLLKKGLAQFLIENGKNCEIYQNLTPDWIAENRLCYFDGVTV